MDESESADGPASDRFCWASTDARSTLRRPLLRAVALGEPGGGALELRTGR